MPIYGEAKTRNMIRSVLPSARRKSARFDLAAIRRQNRRNVRQELATFTRGTFMADDPCDAFDDFEAPVNRYPSAEITEVVWERRNADKLAPLEHWAAESTKHIADPVERYMKVKKVLPDNTIGRHALSHVRNLKGFEEPGYNPYKYSYFSAKPAPPKPDYAAVLMIVVERGKESDLNDAIKASHAPATHSVGRDNLPEPGHRVWNGKDVEIVPCNCGPRLFKGAGDIEQFIDDVFEHRYLRFSREGKLTHSEWRLAAIKRLDYLGLI